MNIDYIVSIVQEEYVEVYSHFKEFSIDPQYKPFWDLCMKTISCRDTLLNIRFCNDVYQMPPVRVFVDVNRPEIERIRQEDTQGALFDEDGNMKIYLKQSLGAFWGMVFKGAMKYERGKSAFIVKNKYYGIQTASRFYFEDEVSSRYITIE